MTIISTAIVAGTVLPAGPPGSSGTSGATGPVGGQGPQGIAGNTGAQGPVPWSSPVTWITGLTCVVGPPATAVIYSNTLYVCTVAHVAGATFNSANWQAVMTNVSAAGQATVNFGVFPGGTDCSLNIADAGILAGSSVVAELCPAQTADHTADEHWVEDLDIRSGNIVAGTGFTIYAHARNGYLYGAYNVSWIRR